MAGLLDLFSGNGGGSSDSGFSLPHLFSDNTSLKMGVVGNNLIAAGFGQSPDSGAMVAANRTIDDRRKFDQLKKQANLYADKIEGTNPELADAIRADPYEYTKIAGEKRALQNQKDIIKYQYGIDNPNAALIQQILTGVTGQPQVQPQGSAPASQSPVDANGNNVMTPTSVPGDPNAIGATNVQTEGRNINILGTPGTRFQGIGTDPAAGQPISGGPTIDPTGSTAAAPVPDNRAKQRAEGFKKLRSIMPGSGDLTDEEVLSIAIQPEKTWGAQVNMLVDNKARAAREQRLMDQQAHAQAWQEGESARKAQEPALTAKSNMDAFNAALPAQPAYIGAIPQSAAQQNTIDQNNNTKAILQQAGLPNDANAILNAQLLRSGAAEGKYNESLAKITAPEKDIRTADQKEYDAAVKAGSFKGTLPDWLSRQANLKNPAPSTLKQGWMWTDATHTSAKPVPGTDTEQAWIKQKDSIKVADESAKIKHRVISEDLADARNLVKDAPWYNPATGLAAESLAEYGGTTAANVAEALASVKANIGFDRLQEMRNASKTGGALGQVAVKELEFLQSVYGSLSQKQSKDQLLKKMDRLQELYKNMSPAARNLAETGSIDGVTPDNGAAEPDPVP